MFDIDQHPDPEPRWREPSRLTAQLNHELFVAGFMVVALLVSLIILVFVIWWL